MYFQRTRLLNIHFPAEQCVNTERSKGVGGFLSLKATFRTETVAESQTNVLNSFLPNINFMNSYKRDFY